MYCKGRVLFFALVLIALASFSVYAEKNEDESTIIAKQHKRLKNPQFVGQVEKTFMDPHIIREGSGKRDHLAIAMLVFEGDRFVTDPQAKIHVRFKDRTFLEMATESSFGPERVRHAQGRKEESVYRFFFGAVRVTAASVEKWVRFFIKHSEHVIQVLGPSDFFIEKKPDRNDLTIYVRAGKIQVSSAVRGGFVVIEEGTVRDVKWNSALSQSRPLTSAQWNELRLKTGIRELN